MPIEGIPAHEPTKTEAQPTSDGTVKTTGAEVSGTDTQTAPKAEAQTEKTFTQADVDRIVQNRLKTAVKAELKKLSGDDEGKPGVEDLQRQLSEKDAKLRAFEAKGKISDFIADGRNKLNVRPENIRGIEALVLPLLEYDEDGTPSNLKDAFESAKSIAPALFANSSASINAGNGRNNQTPPRGMDALIRQATGHGA